VIFAAIINVATAAELTTAIDNAMPGDEIVLADGTYAFTANVNCDNPGSWQLPITVRAANRLGAKITFNVASTEGFKVTAPYWQFDGLDVEGTCASDPNCEHAFHVMGAATDFVLRHSRVRNFNAQLKVNASDINGTFVIPHHGIVEYNEIGDTRGRMTSNPTTKLNIDTGDDWIVRGNYLHDAYKNGGDNISYLAFMKSGGNRGLFERNLVICSKDHTGGTRIGLSFGGGGTGNQFCAPAFDINTPCTVEHTGGTMRNNIIANCSDVGIYVNEGTDSHILYNTLIGTAGIDFNYATATGEAVGNLATGVIRNRNSSTATFTGNMAGVSVVQFDDWYLEPLVGNLALTGDITSLLGAGPAHANVPNDYCGTTRPSGALTLGALEHMAAMPCDTTTPPEVTDPPFYVDGSPTGGDGGTDPGGNNNGGDSGGCCQTQSSPDGSAALLLLALGYVIRRRRTS
jgi:MYXO-CTERM domain-containing protein